MAELQQMFDATQVNPTQGDGQLPVGKHKVIICDSEITETKAKDGAYLKLTLEIVEGPNVGIKGPYRLNLYNSSADAVAIAQRQLSALCHVTGVFHVSDSRQLHDIPFMVEVNAQKDEKYTEIKKVFDVNGNEPGKAPQQPAQNQAPAQTTQNAPQTGWQQNQPQTQANNVAPNQGWNQSAQATQTAQNQTTGSWNAQPAGGPPTWAQNK